MISPQQLSAYLDRIGFDGPPKPDEDTLVRLHRGHISSIPYENLDVQLGRPLTVDPAAAFEKIVTARRGGWCYEMNGLMGAALAAIGFRVTRMAGGVLRRVRGEGCVGNHLVLRIDLDRPWIADAGFGDALLDPVPLEEGPIKQGFRSFRLEQMEDGWWRFHNDTFGTADSFDFRSEPARPGVLEERCEWLQTSPESVFILNAVCQRVRRNRLDVLRGRVLKTSTPDAIETRKIENADEYVGVLKDVFDLDLPEARTLWPRIVARHNELFGA